MVNTSWIMVAASALLLCATSAAANVTLVSGNARSPDGMYGNCGPNFGIGSKRDIATVPGRDATQAQYIDVLECRVFDGGGGSAEVTCPVPGYTWCALSSNDGRGNHIMVGVVQDTTPATCELVAKRSSPVAQIDILVRDVGTGIRGLEFRSGTVNAMLHEYEALSREGQIVVTATKVNQAAGATVRAFFMTDGAQNTTLCGPFQF